MACDYCKPDESGRCESLPGCCSQMSLEENLDGKWIIDADVHWCKAEFCPMCGRKLRRKKIKPRS